MLLARMLSSRFSSAFVKSPTAILILFVLALTSSATARAQEQTLEKPTLDGVTLSGPDDMTVISDNKPVVILETRTPNQTAGATVTVSAHTPPAQVTTRFPGDLKATGFKFEWSVEDDPIKTEWVVNKWVQTANAAEGVVMVKPNRVAFTAADRLFPVSAMDNLKNSAQQRTKNRLWANTRFVQNVRAPYSDRF